MVRAQTIMPALLVTAAACLPLHASLIIVPTFDSSITSQSGAAAIESTIDSAISFFESTYTNNISVSIDFYAMTSGLGESQEGFVYNQSYLAYYNALKTTDANAAAIAGLTANGGNSTKNPVNGTTIINVKSADLRAVGLAGAPLCNAVASGKPADPLTCSSTPGGAGAVDGLVGLNTTITYPPNANDGSTYGLLSTTEHEIDEVLGLSSALPNCDSNPPQGQTACTSASASNPEPEDLFRYTGKGVFAPLNEVCADLSAPAYLSYSGASVITNMNTACNGGDWGDWGGNSGAQVQDAFTGPGAQPAYGSSELAAMSAIGYTLATPEPATWLLLLTSLGVVGCARRRSSVRASAHSPANRIQNR